jgi:5'-deoxynucleotidase YfbR-like HD superfamily hydrolase
MPRTIRMFTGVMIDPLCLDPWLVDIVDIAHALSGENRYSNHTRRGYTVAQHCLVVRHMCEDEDYEYEALMHDAAEAYLRDLPAPVKHDPAFDEYRRIEDKAMMCIAARFGFNWPEPPIVKEWDVAVRKVEQSMFMRGRKPLDDTAGNFGFERSTRADNEKIKDKIKEVHAMRRGKIKRLFLESFYDLRAVRCFPASH